MARALQREGIPFTCVERAEDVGGMWQQIGGAQPGPGYASLCLNTSKRLTAFSDAPMPTSYPMFPRHDQVTRYLRTYAESMGLLQSIEFSSEVVGVRRRASTVWQVDVRSADGSVRQRMFQHVLVAGGHHRIPRLTLPDPLTGGFTGASLHALDYRDNLTFAGQRALIVGFGASAADIAVDVSRVAASTELAVRRGVHVIPKSLFGMPLDEIADMPWWTQMTLVEQRRLMEHVLWAVRGTNSDYGLPEPDHRLFSSQLTISDDLLSRISHGAILPRPAVAGFDGRLIRFADDSESEIDVIVHCTGYDPDFTFLGDAAPVDAFGRVSLYNRIIPPAWPGLAFIGLVRPFGALTRLIERQASWVTALIAGKLELPEVSIMRQEIGSYLTAAASRYGPDPRHSIQVDFAPYAAALAV